jgi:hypothetical protein
LSGFAHFLRTGDDIMDAMTIVSAIIGMLGGLAMFLYGIEVMGDGLKNSSGAALKRVLEKVVLYFYYKEKKRKTE